MIELYELRQFAAFADCGTLSEAAEILHLSQPALSRSMKKIEEEIGCSGRESPGIRPEKPHDFPGHLCPGSKLGAHTASQQPVSRQNAANGNCGGKRFAVWS